jgi:hypothetical protein
LLDAPRTTPRSSPPHRRLAEAARTRPPWNSHTGRRLPVTLPEPNAARWGQPVGVSVVRWVATRQARRTAQRGRWSPRDALTTRRRRPAR